MLKNIFIIVGLFCLTPYSAQEILSQVNVDYSQVQTSNVQVYKTLQKSLQDFINNTRWTDLTVKPVERIECSFSLIITKNPTSTDFSGTLTVQSRRPVFNSNYYTPILNIQDKDFSFKYTEFETLVFNPRKFSGKNLTDVISFYVYVILAADADTFKLNGGTDYYTTAAKITDIANNNGFDGWSAFDGTRNRANLVSQILKPQSKTLRTVAYNYHINGLDKFYDNEIASKTNIANNLNRLVEYSNNPLFYPLEIFLFAKKDEISSMFSGGNPTTLNITELKQNLMLIAPKFTDENWSKLKN